MKQWMWILVVVAMGQAAIVRAETAPGADASHAPGVAKPYSSYSGQPQVDRGARLMQLVSACLNDRPGALASGAGVGGGSSLDDLIRRGIRY